MDRLLCGDVGFGKTEVAMRAAFKALGDGKQVAVLRPTTVLAFQHYESFKRRFAAFPVRIEMLSRFRTAEGDQTASKSWLKAKSTCHRDAPPLFEGCRVSGSGAVDRG